MPDGSLPTSVVRLLDARGGTVGAGVVLGGHVVTCAHVVNLALGLDERSPEQPSGTIEVDFPALDGVTATAHVHSWAPPPPEEGQAGDDVAVLELHLPDDVTPARLISTPLRNGSPVDVLGYPAGRPDGAWVRAVVRGQVGGRLLQLDSDSALTVQRGYSGSPVWDPATGRVVGIIATAATQDSYAITAERLGQAIPEGPDNLTVLHLAGTRFGSGREVWSPGSFGELRPDLIVFTGDLTEHGMPDEFVDGFGFLAEVAEAVRLPRERVVVVPGTRDVNRRACGAYFAQEEAWGRVPTWPYWPKWGPFAAAFQEFYGGRFSFTPDEPWTLFDYPDLELVVAGMNTTMPVTHESDGFGLGEPQVERFEELLRHPTRPDWGRLCAVQGPVEPSSPVDLRLASPRHESASWSLATVPARDRRLAMASTVELRGVSDTFFERVLEATKVAHPTATVTPRPEDHYLRVSKQRPGGGFEQWPVGVSAELEDAELNRFVEQVHKSFAAADPSVPSELVYSGPPAPSELVLAARRKGVRLRSFVEYGGLLDLRPLADRQARRLAADQVYPADLYVPQRFGIAGSPDGGDDLLDRTLTWLREEVARFVVVLGDFGRGKSFLLRQLTRALPDEHPGLMPVLVELRSLEKAPTLDELLAQHLVREGVEDVGVTRLQYMISSGRLALLFDGFDELELRVGYDNAADYLTTLMKAVTDRAKVVLTSRTQHFRSTNQVLNALGQKVSALAASRVVVLEDFTDDQIRSFLTKHYGGDRERAAARFALLGAIHDLLGLSRNPRMLSFIADLDDERLREVQEEHGRISAAELYRELVDFWLVQEVNRQRHRLGIPSFDGAERLAACTALALRLWETTATTIQTSDLADTVVRTLARLTERGYSIDQAAHAVGSGSLLVRTETGGFTFVHQSVMEWLVAKVAADELPKTEIVNRKMSRLMVDFLCDLAGHKVALSWARNVLAHPDAAEAAKQNAAEVARRLEARVHLMLAGADLRAFDFSELDLRGANLSGADLSGQQLFDKDFTGTDLSGANLSDVRMIGGDLTGALLTGSRWDRAALLGVAGPMPAEAAVSGRDAVTPMLAPLGQDVEAMAFSPDGEFVAMARERVVELRHVATDRPVRVWRRRAHPITDIAYAQDGRRIATLEEDGAVFVWDAHTGDLVTGLPHRMVGRIWFVQPGNRLVGRDADGLVQFWDSESGAVTGAMQGLYDDLVVSSDGSTVATRRHDKVEVWSGETVVNSWKMASGFRLALSPSGSTAAACGGGLLAVVGPGSELWSSGVQMTSVEALHFVGENQLALADSSRLEVVVRTSKPRLGLVQVAHLDVTVHRIASSPDGTFAVVSRDRSAALHKSTGIVVQRWWPGTELAVGSASYSSDGRSLLTTCDDGVLRIWDLMTGVVRSEFTGIAGLRRTAAFSPAGPTFAFTTETGFTTIGPDGTTTYKSDTVHWLAISPDGTQLLTSSADRTLTLRDRMTGARLAVYDTEHPKTNAIALSPESGTFAVAGHDGTTAVHRSTDKVLLLKEDRPVLSVAFSPDGSRIATGAIDGTARVWDLAGEQLSARLEGHEQPVHDVAFSPDGRRVVTASSDGTARVWSTSGEHLLTLVGHMTTLGSVTYSPDGTRIATTSSDGTARIWDADSGAELAILVHSEESAVLLPDGSYTGDPGNRVWWAVKQVRFEVGELDPYYPEIRRLGRDDVLPGVVSGA
ncbi:WD40 repeat protein [Saccharothrix ecbatanensis]|uniref:WD40 repeat protein n=1 Tax=Saccharothrix ecbatanensis TaxID=1105145 RepID=A0A7W9HQA8_9PSEU|nr:trypsin-like peptidase domain-containing protein [Saccharothrix ecbatanensis]MBB5806004.1 WD40 repeat protein [Saccharothrix ecbatanensis]